MTYWSVTRKQNPQKSWNAPILYLFSTQDWKPFELSYMLSYMVYVMLSSVHFASEPFGVWSCPQMGLGPRELWWATYLNQKCLRVRAVWKGGCLFECAPGKPDPPPCLSGSCIRINSKCFPAAGIIVTRFHLPLVLMFWLRRKRKRPCLFQKKRQLKPPFILTSELGVTAASWIMCQQSTISCHYTRLFCSMI